MSSWVPRARRGTWHADVTAAETVPEPVEPTLETTSGEVLVMPDLREGDVELAVDGVRLQLWGSRLEWADLEAPAELRVIVSAEKTSTGVPVRLRMTVADPVVHEPLDPRASGVPLMPIESLQVGGDGLLGLVFLSPSGWSDIVLGGSALTLDLEPLDARRPLYVELLSEFCTDGVWDLATAKR